MTDSKSKKPNNGEQPTANEPLGQHTANESVAQHVAKPGSPPDAHSATRIESPAGTAPVARAVADETSNASINQTPTEATQTVQKQQNSGKGVALFALILSLAAIAGTGFTWYQNQVLRVQEESKLSLGVSEIGGQVSRLGDSISRLKLDQVDTVTQAQLTTKVLQLATSVNQEVVTLRDGQAALGESISKINNDLQKGVNQYLLDEVSQLLRLANNSVMFERDPASAVNALTLADNQLKSLRDPRYAVVRTKINQEITALGNAQKVDVAGTSASLHSIAGIIPSLPLANEPEATDTSIIDTPVETSVTWRTELRKLWRDILNSVQIQRVDKPPKPLLAPPQRYFLNQNLQLMLAKAELALLQGEAAVYASSIADANTWLNDYFDLADGRVASVLAQLEELGKQSVGGSLPSITGSYQALQDIRGGS